MGDLVDQVMARGEQAAARIDPSELDRVVQRTPNPGASLSPQPPAVPGGSVELLCPIDDAPRFVTVNPLNGADEEELSRISVGGDMGKLYSSYIARGSTLSFEQVQGLLVGDRDNLLLHIRQATFGPLFEFSQNCSSCEEPVELSFHPLEEFEVRPYGDEPFTVVGVNGDTYGVEFLRVGTHDAAWELDNQAERNTLLLSECLATWQGKPLYETLHTSEIEAARSISIGDRNKILEAIGEASPGPQFGEVKCPCPRCGEANAVEVRAADLL